MIEVKLTFPDQAALLHFFAGGTPTAVKSTVDLAAETQPAKSEASPPKPKAEKTAPDATPRVAPAVSPLSAASPPAAAPTAPSVDYATLQKAVFKLAGIPGVGRTEAVAAAAEFGVKTFKELAPEQWGAALAVVEARLAQHLQAA